jgi:hypothetical protein
MYIMGQIMDDLKEFKVIIFVFVMSKRFLCAYFIVYVCKLSNVGKNKEI